MKGSSSKAKPPGGSGAGNKNLRAKSRKDGGEVGAQNGPRKKSSSAALAKKPQPSSGFWSTLKSSPTLSILSAIVLILGFIVGVWLVFYSDSNGGLGFKAYLHEEEDEKETEVVVEKKEEEPTIYRVIDGVKSDRDLNPQPIAVMIENLSVVRPQSGLGLAPLVYETLAEGGITRFMAVFTDEKVNKIGPVRSARPYYLEWASELDAIYAHAGGSPQALEAISGLGIPSFNAISGEGRFFYRDSSRYAPHNLFTNTDLLALGIRDKGYGELTPDYPSWNYKDDPPLEDRPKTGKGIHISWSSPSYDSAYVYDRDQNGYLRSNGGIPHIDAISGNQILVKNVIIQRIPAETPAGEKGRIFLDVTGTGEAFFLIDGKIIHGTWEKTDRESRTRFYGKDGKEIELNRGNTWIHVVPGDREVTEQ